MSQQDRFSVYNVLGRNADSPLSFLLPESDQTGWHVARNLKKPLNHLDLLRRKEQVATELRLHNVLTAKESFDRNYDVLEKHQRGVLSTDSVIEELVSQARADGLAATAAVVRRRLREYATVAHMEFHPSDRCNLCCQGCTYGHGDPETKPVPTHFPLAGLGRIAELRPQSINIIGGGEPTLYKSGQAAFQKMVEQISDANSGVVLSLVTNGTHRPGGDWPNRMSWIRVSLDAATKDTYRRFRGRSMFEKVLKHFLEYLDFDVPFVGISFLYARTNVHEYAQVAHTIFHLVTKHKPDRLPKVNIQYRPLRRDPRDHHKPFALAVCEEDIHRTVLDVTQLAQSSSEMERFLREQTNVTAILGGNTHPPYEFARCHYSQAFRIVRANGDLRPCFIRVVEPDFVLGNILTDPLETIALNALCIGAKRKLDCNSRGCRQCHVNYVFEQGLEGNMEPSGSPQVAADPMF